jgi:hypothetical protein
MCIDILHCCNDPLARLKQEKQRNYLNGTVHSHRKTEQVFFLQLEMFDVPKGRDRCSSEEYRFTHVDACVARN